MGQAPGRARTDFYFSVPEPKAPCGQGGFALVCRQVRDDFLEKIYRAGPG